MTEAITEDALENGALVLQQHKHGYRFNLDAVLLAHFAMAARAASRPASVLDLGTGCGVIALLLKHHRTEWQVEALELQPALAGLAAGNADRNRLEVPIHIGDLREPPAEWRGRWKLVVSNPPYFSADSGHVSETGEKALARHDATAKPEELARALRFLLSGDGAGCVVYPAARLGTLLAACAAERLSVTRLCCVHPRLDAAAGVALVEVRPRSKRPLVVMPPLVVHAPEGGYSAAVRAMLGRGDAIAEE